MNVTPDMSVAEIATALPRAIPVFQRHGIDFCCGGKRPLGEACEEKGVAADSLIAEIESSRVGPEAAGADWATGPLADLVAHVLDRYHADLRSELPRLDALMAKVVQAHGEAHGDTLGPLRDTFVALRAELESHMEKEEHVLFPYVRELEQAARGMRPALSLPLGLAEGATGVMEREHETAGAALTAMRSLTGGYRPPEGACGSFRALYAGLEILEADLHRHIHLENNVMFPRANTMEAHLRGDV
jgi:regulator of cell morphogenesis and NO signaling